MSFEFSESAPLAHRLRPQSFDELYGQEKTFGKDAPIRRLIEADKFHSLIFWGPPGTGKTTAAHIVGQASGRKLVCLSAVSNGVKDIRAAIDESKDSLGEGFAAHLLFMDEIHRLNKNQQDVLLPAVEDGSIKLIGATTENPSFEVNHALLSRSHSVKFEMLDMEARHSLVIRALHLAFPERPLPQRECVTEWLAKHSSGDARQILNQLDVVMVSLFPDEIPDEARLGELAVAAALRYDKSGDQHYDLASAMIKSIRASDPDAALYYAARMLAGGEDPVFVARRVLIAASEDVGNANPTALLVAQSAFQAVHVLGMPEARIPLAQAITYLACSPKSNRAYLAMNEALEDAKKFGPLEVPMHLRNAPTTWMKKEGMGKGYVYAHDDLAAARQQDYLPRELQHKRYYEPSMMGVESQLAKNLRELRPHGSLPGREPSRPPKDGALS